MTPHERLGLSLVATREEIEAAYTKAWSSVGKGNPELERNGPAMSIDTYMKLTGELREIKRAKEALLAALDGKETA